jgi:hypothetical protein
LFITVVGDTGALGLGQALADLGDQRGALLVAHRIFGDIDAAKLCRIDGLSSEGLSVIAGDDPG